MQAQRDRIYSVDSLTIPARATQAVMFGCPLRFDLKSNKVIAVSKEEAAREAANGPMRDSGYIYSTGVEHTFRLEHLVVADSCAEFFDICGAFVGNQFVLPLEAIPAGRFTLGTQDISYGSHRVARPGIQITVNVRNNTDGPVFFTGACFGKELC